MPAVEITDKVKSRLQIIASRTVLGDTQKEIAEDMGLTRNALYYNISKHRDRYNELLDMNLGALTFEHIRRIDELWESGSEANRKESLRELGKTIRAFFPKMSFQRKESLEVHVTADQLAWRQLLDYLSPSAQREVISAVKSIESEQDPSTPIEVEIPSSGVPRHFEDR